MALGRSENPGGGRTSSYLYNYVPSFQQNYFLPWANTFLTTVRKHNTESIWNVQGFTIPNKNSCFGNYLRKYITLEPKEVCGLLLSKVFYLSLSWAFAKLTRGLNTSSYCVRLISSIPSICWWKLFHDNYHGIFLWKAWTYLQLPLQQLGTGNVYLLVLSSWKVNIAEIPLP